MITIKFSILSVCFNLLRNLNFIDMTSHKFFMDAFLDLHNLKVQPGWLLQLVQAFTNPTFDKLLAILWTIYETSLLQEYKNACLQIAN